MSCISKRWLPGQSCAAPSELIGCTTSAQLGSVDAGHTVATPSISTVSTSS